ncbi:MAG: DUF1800 domain-containing protein, partial [Bryobacterales bacterium]|nr:DUF1800 domain-containing protein [Bryobacterales bacterium]
GRAPLITMQQQFFANALSGGDQLRQRVAFALSQIWVVSGLKLNDASQMVPYLELLSRDAFANYRQVMNDITLSPAMGRYLDMVNNDKPNPVRGTAADENYAREILQLFTIGLNRLNPDGTLQLDGNAKPVVTYHQETIQEFARVFTGWSYAPRAAMLPRAHNPANFDAPMVAWEANHDTGQKILLDNFMVPRGQTAEQDLNSALDNIFQHPNMGPFLALRLIQHLVTSNPSPAYVERISRTFDDNGRGVRGDMAAVVRAILLDREARAGDEQEIADDEGHLREPVIYLLGLLRAFGAGVTAPNGLPAFCSNMGENVYLSPSVFNYFPPDYRIEESGLVAPEFGILSPATAMIRADLVNALVYGRISGVRFNLAPWVKMAAEPDQLLDQISLVLFGGAMPDPVRQSIRRAMDAQTGNTAKARAALYLAATAGVYQVAR